MCSSDDKVDDHCVRLDFIPEDKSVFGFVVQSSTAI